MSFSALGAFVEEEVADVPTLELDTSGEILGNEVRSWKERARWTTSP
jgi:hypothetical protein